MAGRGISRLLLSLAMVAGSLAWTGFTLQMTAFNADRTEDVLGVLLDSDTVRSALLQQVVNATDEAIPPEIRAQVSLEQLTTAASATLDDPTVRATLETAIVDSHRYVIGDIEEPPTIDTALIDAAVRQQLNAVRPDLAEVIPTIEPITVGLPAIGLMPARILRDLTQSVTPVLALFAVCAALAGLLISPNRPAALTRIGVWAMSMGAMWVALRFLLPPASTSLLGDGGAIVAELTDAASAGMAAPGTLMFVAGIVLVGVASLLRALPHGGRGAVPRAAAPATRRSAAAPNPPSGGGRGGRRPATPTTPATPAAGPAHRTTRHEDPVTYAPPRPTPRVTPDPPLAPAPPDMSAATGTPATPARPARPVAPAPTTPPAAAGRPGATGVDPAAGPAGRRREVRDRAVQADGPVPAPLFPVGDHPVAPGRSENPAVTGIPLPPRPRVEERPEPNEWLGGFSMNPDDHDRIAGPAPAPPRWVEGIGYVYDEPPTEGARWIEGVGYAFDDN